MKKMITAKYVSIRQFANEISISYTTLQSIFKRGLKAGIQNIIKHRYKCSCKWKD